MGDLVKPAAIMAHVTRGQVDTDVCQEDIASEAERWEKGNARERRVAVAYRALDEGRQLIDINKALASGGVDGHGRPNLAVARSRMRMVRLETWASRRLARFSAPRHGRVRANRWRFEIEMTGLGDQFSREGDGHSAVAATPTMPPEVRVQSRPGDLLFWEATWKATWKRSTVKRTVVRDPALLEPVVGNLYVVKASWELSELEAAALGG